MRLRFFLFASSVVFAGCNALLGIESSSFDPPADAATADSPAPGTDARAEAAADATLEDVVEASSDAEVDAEADADADAAVDADAEPDAAEVCPQDCLGGACTDGVCQPFTVVDLGAQDLVGLTVAGDSVFWTNGTKRQLQTATGVAAAPVSIVLTLPDTNAFNAGDISSDTTHVYFAEEDATDDASITYRVARVGQTERNASAETIIDQLPAAPTDVVAEGPGNIIWNEFAEGRVLRCAGVPCGSLIVVATGEEFPGHLSTRGGRIAWATLNTKLVRLRPTGGGSPTTIATAQGLVGTALVTKTTVFYSDLGHGFVAHDFAGSMDRPVSDDKNVTQSALDPDGLTLWYASSGTLARAPAAGGTPQIVASSLAALRALSVGARGVYWLDTSGDRHRVRGIAK